MSESFTYFPHGVTCDASFPSQITVMKKIMES